MKKIAVLLMVTGLLMVGRGIASADLLFDRGLPTINLNNAAGVDRSNVAWADYETLPVNESWLPGDDVVLSGSGIYHIDTVRVWTTTADNGTFSLIGGKDINSLDIFSDYTVNGVKYSNGEDYQKSGDAFTDIYQLDFNINRDVMAGTTYYYFLSGGWSISDDGTGAYSAFLHASNADLSGSPQEGADDTFQWLHVKNGAPVAIESWLSTGGGTTGWGAGWDKNSDANIQVYGAPVPEPATMLLLGTGLIGLVGARRKYRK